MSIVSMEQQRLPRIYSLSALADRLRTESKFNALVAAIDGWTHRNSRLIDLRHALDLLAHLDGIIKREKLGKTAVQAVDFDGDLKGALLAHAILLYVRATKTNGDNGRKYSFDLDGRYDAHQSKLHQELLSLRDRVLAHYDSDSRQDWLRGEAILVIRDAQEWEYGFSFSRTTYQKRLFREFSSLLTWLIPILEVELHTENDVVHRELEAALNADEHFQREVMACKFDAEDFYGRGPATPLIQDLMKQPGGTFTGNVRCSS